MSLPQGHKSCQQTAPAVPKLQVPLSLGPQILPGWTQTWASHSIKPFGHPPTLVWGPPWAAAGFLLPQGPPWAAVAGPHLGLHHGLQENPCSSAWSTSSFCTNLDVHRTVSPQISHFHFSLSCYCRGGFTPF